MLGPALVVALGVALALATALSPRTRIAAPVLLLVFGAALAFIPAFGGVQLPADAVLLLFLPALLFWESLTTSLREIRNNLRGIILMGSLLVAVTAGGVAVMLHLAGLAWGPSWVLGAAIAPTDATAVGVLTTMLPRRNVTVLRAESLVNDGTALVIYALAVAVTAGTQKLTVLGVTGNLVLSYAGGIAAGAAVAWVGMRVLRRVNQVALENLVTLLVPFTAFLVADAIGASGVLAVVVAGLVVSQVGPKINRAESRQQQHQFWTFAMFLLNGALFVLVGIEATASVRALANSQIVRGLVLVGLVTIVLVGIRFAFQFTAAGSVWVISRVTRATPRESHRDRLISGFAGFRGAVSLAAAVAVPKVVSTGAAFPDRDLIVFVTSGVVVVTVVVQSLVLPFVVRRADFPADVEMRDELLDAERTSTEEALESLPELADEAGAHQQTADRVRNDYEKRLEVLELRHSDEEDDEHPVLQRHDAAVQLQLALIRQKSETVLRMRDDGDIDDLVLRQIRSRLDAEEARLLGQGGEG